MTFEWFSGCLGRVLTMFGCVFTGLAVVAGCGGSEPPSAPKASWAAAKRKKAAATTARKTRAPVDVFADDAVYHYAITVAPEDWALINRFPVKEQYIRGKLEFEGYTFEPIAL